MDGRSVRDLSGNLSGDRETIGDATMSYPRAAEIIASMSAMSTPRSLAIA